MTNFDVNVWLKIEDYSKALVRFEFAALLGNLESILNAAYCFENGLIGDYSIFKREIARFVYFILFYFILLFVNFKYINKKINVFINNIDNVIITV